MALLDTVGITKNFGGLKALNNVSIKVEQGKYVGLIGPNGSGKTTFINVVTGIYRPSEGKIRFNEKDITSVSINKRVKMGMSRTFQILKLFSNFSVIQNMKITQLAHLRSRGEEELDEKMEELLKTLDLWSKRDTTVNVLSLYDQKKLDIAMRMMCEPRLLILDEPVGGLSPPEVAEMTEYLLKIKRSLTLLIIEHTMKAIADLTDRVVVLDHGKKIAEGTHSEIMEDEQVKEAYLGEKKT